MFSNRLIALLFALTLSLPASAQVPMTGAGKGAPAPSYTGPGDIVSGALIWGSCARVYNAAAASTSTSLCDLVAVTGGATVCTLRGTSTGFVDLAASYCAGTTPSAACAAASGGSCKVTKVYDQSGSGRDFTMATLSQMPGLTFSAINGLPALTCATANSTRMNSPATFTLSQPFTFVAVFNRTSGTAGTNFLDFQNVYVGLGGGVVTANKTAINAGNTAGDAIQQNGNDNAFHSVQGVFNSTNSAMNTDGTDITSQTTGTNAPSSDLARLCRDNGGTSAEGYLMEAGIWSGAFNSTQRSNMNTNNHGTNGYNF